MLKGPTGVLMREKSAARGVDAIAWLQNRRPRALARLGSFSDQGFQGVGNIAANALLARSLTHEEFATIGMMIGVHYFAWGFHRSNIILPLILNASEIDGGEHDEDAWWWLNLISIVLVGAVLGLIAIGYAMIDPSPKDRWMIRAVAYAAWVSPWLCAIEFGRRRLYQRGRGVGAAIASGASSAVLLAVALWVWVGPHTIILGASGWALGGLVGSIVAWIAAPPKAVPVRTIAAVWRHHRHFAFWQTMTAIPYAFYTTIVVILVAAFSGPAAVAAFTAARTLTNPAMALVSAVDTLDKPRAARALYQDGLPGLKRSIRRTLLTVIGLTGPYLAVLTLFSGYILHAVFGAAFKDYGFGVSLLAVAAFFACLNQAPETALIVLRAGKAMFSVRLAVAFFTVVSMWIGAHWFGFIGCAIALLGTNIVNFGGLRVAADRVNGAWESK